MTIHAPYLYVIRMLNEKRYTFKTTKNQTTDVFLNKLSTQEEFILFNNRNSIQSIQNHFIVQRMIFFFREWIIFTIFLNAKMTNQILCRLKKNLTS